MLSTQRIAIVFLSMVLSVFIGAASALAAGNAQAIPGEYLVKYKGQSFVSIPSIRATPSVRIADHNGYGRLLKVFVNQNDEVGALARLLSNPNVEYVVPNIKIHAFYAPPSTQTLKEQWALQKVNAEKAWTRAGNKGARSVVVAVIDTGADYNHESLKSNMVQGYDFKENTTDPMDKTGSVNPGHGTHCSGIIGATGLIEGGTMGISPEVSIMPLRFLGEDGSGDLNAAIKAMDFAVEKKVQVISASWGATVARSTAMPLVEAVQRASNAGVIFVAAAANDGKSNDKTEVFPANATFDNTITVAASGPQDEKPSWSNYGKRNVHLASPGLTIMSTLPGNKYGNLSGTSMATPLVSGMVAFLKAQRPELTGAQVRALLQLTGAKAQIETACNCRVDALSAVDMLLSNKMFITPAAGTVEVGSTMKFAGTYGKAPFTFELSNGSAGAITAEGVFTASAPGDTTITVKDAAGQISTSLPVTVVAKGDNGGGGGPTPPGGGGGGDCPLGDPSLCDAICQIQPQLPFCKK